MVGQSAVVCPAVPKMMAVNLGSYSCYHLNACLFKKEVLAV